MEEQERERREVRRVVVQELRDHHLRVAEQLVLVAVQVSRGVEQLQVEDVVEIGQLGDVLAVEVALDQVAAERVGEADEVGPRRVQRVEERARLADQRPAVGREEARGPVREVLDARKSMHVLAPAIELGVQLWLVLACSHSMHASKLVDLLQRVEARVGAHADADRAGREPNQPHPVARAESGGWSSELRRPRSGHPAQPLLVVGSSPRSPARPRAGTTRR